MNKENCSLKLVDEIILILSTIVATAFTVANSICDCEGVLPSTAVLIASHMAVTAVNMLWEKHYRNLIP